MLQAKIINLETERQRRPQKRAEWQQKQILDKALFVFKMYAMRRDKKSPGYENSGTKWNALSQNTREMIEDFNQLPGEAQPVMLMQLRKNLRRDLGDTGKPMEQFDRS